MTWTFWIGLRTRITTGLSSPISVTRVRSRRHRSPRRALRSSTSIFGITKASTLGMAGLLGASAVFHGMHGNGFLGEILAMWFVMLTNPVGGHMIARSAYLVGIPMTEHSVIDELDRAGEAADAAHDVE